MRQARPTHILQSRYKSPHPQNPKGIISPSAATQGCGIQASNVVALCRYLIGRYHSTKAHRATAFVSHRGFFAFELNSSLTDCYPGAHPRTVLIQTATSGSAPRSVATRAHLDDANVGHAAASSNSTSSAPSAT